MSQMLTEAYRPYVLDDIVGQSTVKATVRAMLSTGRVPRAILVTGPYGCGKTTITRILARTLLCLKPDDGLACRTCTACVAFDRKNAVDYMENDSASDRGIDAIRDLCSKVRSRPMVSKYRVVVLDEAHGLTGPSLQALLKTLEEPPEHMVILLVTTNPEKLPATIVSRCSQLKLKPVSVEDCTKLLVRIAKDKDLYASGITEQHLERIARSTEAHPRNALHALDQVYTMVLGSQDGSQALDSGQIDQYVKDVSQASAQSVAASIVRSMLDGQVGASLKRAEDNRPDSAQIIEHISSYCRQALVFVTAPKVFDPYYSEVFQGIELLQNKQSSQVLLEVYEVFVNLLAQTASYAVPADQVIDFGIAKGALLCKTFKKAQTETQSPPRPEPQPKTEIPVTETKVLRQPAKPEGDFAGLTERKVHTQAQG